MAFHDTLGHRSRNALDAILNNGDLNPKTAEELIRKAWRAGLYHRSTTTHIARARNALYRAKDER